MHSFEATMEESYNYAATASSFTVPSSPAEAPSTPPPPSSPRSNDLALYPESPLSPTTGRGYHFWKAEEEQMLISAVSKFGAGNWEAIRASGEFSLGNRSALQLKDKWRNLVKYKRVPIALEEDSRTMIKRRVEKFVLPPLDEPDNLGADDTTAASAAGGGGGLKRLPSFDCPQTPSRSEVAGCKRSFDSICSGGPSETMTSPLSPSSSSSAPEEGNDLPSVVMADLAAPSARNLLHHQSAMAWAERRVLKGRDMLQTALQIVQDANCAVSSALAIAKAHDNNNASCDIVKGTCYVASLAQQKAAKARVFLEQALKELAQAQGAAEMAQLCMTNNISEFQKNKRPALDMEPANQLTYMHSSSDLFAVMGSVSSRDIDLDNLVLEDLESVIDEIGDELSDDEVLGLMKC